MIDFNKIGGNIEFAIIKAKEIPGIEYLGYFQAEGYFAENEEADFSDFTETGFVRNKDEVVAAVGSLFRLRYVEEDDDDIEYIENVLYFEETTKNHTRVEMISKLKSAGFKHNEKFQAFMESFNF